MAIPRTPMIEDDGSGLTGTPINNSWKQELYGQIDGSCAFVNQANNFLAGQALYCVNPYLIFTDPSAAVNSRVWRMIRYTGLADLRFEALSDDYSVLQGTPLVMYRTGAVAIQAGIYERGRPAPLGEWQDVAWDTNWFAIGSGGNWLVTTAPTFAYTLVGKTMTLSVSVSASTTYFATANLRILIPGGIVPARQHTSVGHIVDPSAYNEIGLAIVRAGSAWVELYRPAYQQIPTAATLQIDFTITFSI